MKSKKAPSPTPIPYKPCSIKLLPPEEWEAAAKTAAAQNPMNRPAMHQLLQAAPKGMISKLRLSAVHTKFWGAGGVKLTVGFLDTASGALKSKILSHMNAWGKYCNVKFALSNSSPQVRISFSTPPPDDGYWSYLGTDILHIKPNEPTMNLDSFSMSTPDSEFFRVVRHETGHTLGFPHEHLRAEIINKLNKAKTISYFMRTQGWTKEDVIQQVLTPIPESALLATAHADPKSIMCYELPGEITVTGKPIPGGVDIDPMDKKFAGMIYPKKK
jgi:hypothetical protein